MEKETFKFFIHLRGSSTLPSKTSATTNRASKLISKSILSIVSDSVLPIPFVRISSSLSPVLKRGVGARWDGVSWGGLIGGLGKEADAVDNFQ